ncbi:hypothetical protein JCM14036_02940 [Desulfotomaculum defluvii]
MNVENLSFRELEETLVDAWNNPKTGRDRLLSLQSAWEQQIYHLTDNMGLFLEEIKSWDTGYLEQWVSTNGELYKVYGEGFSTKCLFFVAKRELQKRKKPI